MRMKFVVVIALLAVITVLSGGRSIAADTTYFRGTVVYTITSRGDSSDPDMQLFTAFAPISHTVIFGSGRRIRLRDQEGLGGANMIVDLENDIHYQLRDEDRIALKLTRVDYDAFFAPTVLEPMEDTETIDGYLCRKCRIASSPFIRPGAVGYVWVTDQVHLLRERGEYNHEHGFRGLFPLPMVLGVREGTVMKLEVTEQGVTATYTADLEAGEPAEDIFAIPAGYHTE